MKKIQSVGMSFEEIVDRFDPFQNKNHERFGETLLVDKEDDSWFDCTFDSMIEVRGNRIVCLPARLDEFRKEKPRSSIVCTVDSNKMFYGPIPYHQPKYVSDEGDEIFLHR